MTLNEAANSTYKNNAFFSNLTEIGTILDEIKRHVEKYIGTNSVKRKFIASDIRHKLKGLEYSLSFQIRLIDTIYVSPPMMEMQNYSNSGINMNAAQTEEMRVLEHHMRLKLTELDEDLNNLKKKDQRPKVSIDDIRRKPNKKRSAMKKK